MAMDVKESTAREPTVAKRRAPDFTEQLIEPITQLRNEVDRLFDSFPLRLPTFRFGRIAAVPLIDMSETDKAYKVTAELPGMDPENVDVTFDDGVLRIAGEKREQREENEKGYRFSERTYGSFERLLELPSVAQGDKIKAKFKNGVLTVTVPKDEKGMTKAKRIAIERG
jgi:HSP20 family protein